MHEFVQVICFPPPLFWGVCVTAIAATMALQVIGVVMQIRASPIEGAMGILMLGIVCIAIAGASWGLDMFYCADVQALNLHAWGWHLFSCVAIGCLHWVFAMVLTRRDNRDRFTVLGWPVAVTGSRQSSKSA